MTTYISLIEYTAAGIEHMDESPERLAQAKEVCAANGGELKQFFLTLGRYDAVAITEFPDKESATTALLTIARAGSISTETLTAFTEEEYGDLIAGLPE